MKEEIFLVLQDESAKPIFELSHFRDPARFVNF